MPGIEIENAKISSVTLSMADHGCLTFMIFVEGSGWGQGFGGWSIGHGYLGANEFEGSAAGLECMMRIMNAVGVERWEDLEGKYCRIQRDSKGTITSIANIVDDNWFNVRDFFLNYTEKHSDQEVEE